MMAKTLCVFLFICAFFQTAVFEEMESTAESTEMPTKESGFEMENNTPALLKPPKCGQSTLPASRILWRVVGGENATLDEWPWMAVLGYNSSDDIDWKCGGSLISERHVLTAAHCIHNFERTLHLVRLGELDLAREDDGAHPIDVAIKEMIKHELYDANTLENDIGILTLQNEVEFTKSIHPICIPKGTEWTKDFEGTHPFIAGWGRTSHGGDTASHLQFAAIQVVSHYGCTLAYKPYNRIFDERVLCAGAGKKFSCLGDSGGPLMMPMASTIEPTVYYYAMGIVSYGSGCADYQIPGVYTKVIKFVPWIEEKVLGRAIN